MKLLLTIIISMFAIQQDRVLYIMVDDTFLNIPERRYAENTAINTFCTLELSKLEKDKSIKKHLGSIYFDIVGDEEKASLSEVEQAKSTAWILEKYKTTFGNFKKRKYALGEDGKLIAFDLNAEFDQIYLIIKNGDKDYIKFKVKQSQITID
ncbi:MAG: hypothetical protein ACI9QN_002218 [Arcticibacterium sp.]|jgi:hypothetical protein